MVESRGAVVVNVRDSEVSLPARMPWTAIIAATLIVMITMGGRQVSGLFIMGALAATALRTLPLAWPLRQRAALASIVSSIAATEISFGAQLRAAARDPSYLWLLLGFSTCGFHVALLVTHMPGVVQMCGLSASVAATSIGLVGARYLSTLFGFAMLAHQVGAFCGAWLGGYTVTRFGDYSWMFIADALLALLAALGSVPVREARLVAATV